MHWIRKDAVSRTPAITRVAAGGRGRSRSLADAQALLAKTWPDAYFLNETFVVELQRSDST